MIELVITLNRIVVTLIKLPMILKLGLLLPFKKSYKLIELVLPPNIKSVIIDCTGFYTKHEGI